MIRFQCASKAALSCGSSLTNAAIRLASRSSCCSKKMQMSEDSTFRIVIVTELFILYFLPNETKLSHRWGRASVANIREHFIKLNLDFTASSGWLQRLVRSRVY